MNPAQGRVFNFWLRGLASTVSNVSNAPRRIGCRADSRQGLDDHLHECPCPVVVYMHFLPGNNKVTPDRSVQAMPHGIVLSSRKLCSVAVSYTQVWGNADSI
jgi:hypothetical protein